MAEFLDPLGLAIARASGLLLGTLLLYPPLAWLERWASLGPRERERLGKAPLLPISHALKLLSKRAPAPTLGDGLVHAFAPVMLLVPVLFVLAQIPPGPPLQNADGEFVSLAVTAGFGSLTWALALLFVTPAGVLLAGWSGGDHLALLGALRLCAVRTSALVVVALGCGGVARVHGSLEIDALITHQASLLFDWVPALGIVVNPLGFGAALVALAVLSQRGQRTRPDKNPDLVEVYSVTARGPTQLAHRLFVITDLLASAALVCAVFLGGWIIPSLDDGTSQADPVFTLLRVLAWLVKVLIVSALLLVVNRSLPPLRHDQALRLVWVFLIPLGVLGLVASSFVAPWVS